MPSFYCKIGTSDGRVLEKEFHAASPELLRENLEEQGFFVFQVRRRLFQSVSLLGRGGKKLTGRRFLSFNQELQVLLRSGLPILKVLDTLIERMEPGTTLDVLREVREDVRGGSSLSDAFGKFPQVFPNLYVASIRAGERTGELPVTLGRYIVYQKRVEAIKAKVRGASFYPILLTVAVVAVLLFLLLYVIPTFTQIYADAKVELPFITRALMMTADGLTKGLPLLVPAAVGGAVALKTFLASDRGALLFDRLKLRLPFFRNILVDYALSAFARTLGTTLSSGIPVVQAMHMSRGTLNNRILEGRLAQAIQKVEEGAGISESLEGTGFFPIIALRMIGVGETTGALTEMLTDVSDYYESEVERRLDRMTTMIEPMMMMSMGLLVGGIVAAMYIPIFQLAGTAAG